MLLGQTAAQFLDNDQEWFWMPNGAAARNRLSNVTRRMLSVANPLDLQTIRDGTRRLYRNKSAGSKGYSRSLLVPPRVILAAFYTANPAFAFEDGLVRPRNLLDYRTELGETEQTMVEVLRSTPTGMLDRSTFLAACEERGMNAYTLSAFLSFSPIIQHVDTNIWALRGVHIDPVAVQHLREKLAMRPRERRIQDFGWRPGGNLWLAARLPSLTGTSFVQGIPADIARFVSGQQFRATAEDDTDVGAIIIDEKGISWGYTNFLAREGADEGDILYIEFNLVRKSAMLKLEAEEDFEVDPE